MLRARQSQSGADEFLALISNPFQSQIQVNSIYAAIIWAFAVSGGLFLLFVLLRPRNSAVYAPRAKHADERHAPLLLGKSPFAWTKVVKGIEEQDLVEKIGLDAVVFLRFLRMLRNIFLIFSVIGCGVLIPLNIVGGHDLYSQWSNIATLMKFTPQYIFGQKFWGYVVLAYAFQFVLFFFIWSNYKAVLGLKRRYFGSHDYKSSLHSRTLLVTHIPHLYQSDEGVSEIAKETEPTYDVPNPVAARNVRDLPRLIEQHDQAVRQLESQLAKHLADPEKLPAIRPLCKVAKEDKKEHKDERVDAIDYLQTRTRRLRSEIEENRRTVDDRDIMPYGFASYTHIEDAHAVAYAACKHSPHGSTIQLAPKPHNLIWHNLPMSRSTRRVRTSWNSLCMVLLTIAYIPFNILSAVFLSDFSHLGLLWSDFNQNLNRHPVAWGIAQGIIAPAFQFLIFLGLPSIFRKLYSHAGDTSKTSRERHVMARLYAFFVVNNLIVFSVFGSAIRFLASVVEAQDQDIWDVIKNAHIFTNLMAGLCNVSTFWLTYQMQQNLGAAIDIAQLLTLITRWSKRKFTHPTPRQLIELSAPPPFDYASYYNNYLFVCTVGMCFGVLQPIILPITAFYLLIELFFKRYMLQYIAITKNESGGMFWRTLINRVLVANLLCNAVIALVVGAQGVGAYDLISDTARNASMLYTMIPLPFFTFLFKWYCSKKFDTKLRYFSTVPKSDLEDWDGTVLKNRKSDRVAVRFGHPALYRKLITPMVDAKAEHLMKQLLSAEVHRGSVGGDTATTPMFGYSDMFVGEPADKENQADSERMDMQLFEFVQEGNLDYQKFKGRAEFKNQFGGDGELFGVPEDLISRSGTPSTFRTLTMDIPIGDANRMSAGLSTTVPTSMSRVEGIQPVSAGERNMDVIDVESLPQITFARGRADSVDVDIPGSSLDHDEILAAARVVEVEDMEIKPNQ